MRMKSGVKNQHYVPQFYLKLFSIPCEYIRDNPIDVYKYDIKFLNNLYSGININHDKCKKHVKRCCTTEMFYDDYDNTDENSEPLEHKLSRYESRWSKVISELYRERLDKSKIKDIIENNQKILFSFLLCQMLRTPKSMKKCVSKYIELLKARKGFYYIKGDILDLDDYSFLEEVLKGTDTFIEGVLDGSISQGEYLSKIIDMFEFFHNIDGYSCTVRVNIIYSEDAIFYTTDTPVTVTKNGSVYKYNMVLNPYLMMEFYVSSKKLFYKPNIIIKDYSNREHRNKNRNIICKNTSCIISSTKLDYTTLSDIQSVFKNFK